MKKILSDKGTEVARHAATVELSSTAVGHGGFLNWA
jgi:hypothetical protein